MKRLTVIDHELIIDHNHDAQAENSLGYAELKLKKNRRFFSFGTMKGIQSAKNIFSRLSFSAEETEKCTGIYCSQFGYLHPNLGDLLNGIDTEFIKNKQDAFYTIWHSNKTNPFLVTLSLSNNLLGLASQELGIKSDCASFLRDNIGLLAALREAQLLLNSGKVTYALIMASGIAETDENDSNDNEKLEFGVSFMLKLSENESEKSLLPGYDDLFDIYRSEGHPKACLSFIKKLISDYC